MIDSLVAATNIKVPNRFPIASGIVPYRIAIVGDYPDESSEFHKQIFCPNPTSKNDSAGGTGRYLRALLQDSNINIDLCYLGNICQYRYHSKTPYQWGETQEGTHAFISDGLLQLREDLLNFQPNLIILLGALPLRAALGTYRDKKKIKHHSISNWRGSLFACTLRDSPFYGFKCLPTYHPISLFKVHSDLPFVRFDLKKARQHACYKELPKTELILDVSPTFDSVCSRLRLILEHKIPISIDIEGYVNAISCISVSPTPKEAFIIPFINKDSTSFWSLDQEVEILYLLALVLEDTLIPKTLQNGMYDRFVIAWTWKMLIRNMKDDIMLKHWEIYCEFEKSLAVQTSIYTNHPYYKSDRLSQDDKVFWEYCCKDSAITNECNEAQTKLLAAEKDTRSLNHYRFNTALLDPFLFIELKGMRLDHSKKQTRLDLLRSQAWFEVKGDNKSSGGTEQLKLEAMVGWQINVNSPIDMQKFLYSDLGLKVVTKKRADGTLTPTANYETLLRFGKEANAHPAILQAIKVRQIRKHYSGIFGLSPDFDGRVRASTNIVGTNTGRTTNATAPTGEGTNLQTIPSDDRDLFPADDFHDLCQCDLAGADGWTVAAHCARLGDKTMLEDYLFGLKPAKILALMMKHGASVNRLDRPTLKAMSKDINGDTDKTNNFIYFSCKCGQHGTNYRMGIDLLDALVFNNSEGVVNLGRLAAGRMQALYLSRYPGVKLWHQWIAQQLKTHGHIISASGNKRIFFGRKDDTETLGAACSTEPQNNTTYATNLALLKLWLDPENRRSDNSLRIWPCHQVHDALILQWLTQDREWATNRVKHYFNNPITIAGIQITIPFEGRFGPSWGEQTTTFN